MGFTVVVDMRGSTWGTVKPVLKELHLTFAHTVNIVYIIKPDNFWQKQRTSIGTHKYKFEVCCSENLANLFEDSKARTLSFLIIIEYGSLVEVAIQLPLLSS